MRVLLISQYFPPEVTAASARVHAFAVGLAARGHEVEVICEVPNHPSGIVAEGYRGRPVVRRAIDGARVRYVWVKAGRRKTTATRILNYGSFAAMALAAGTMRRRADVVLASSPPLPAAWAARWVAARHGAPWVLDVRDLWPEAALAVGELSPGRASRALERLERRLYRSADAITTVTEPFRSQIAERLDDPAKITLVPNGTTDMWIEAGAAEVEKAELGLPTDRFVWTYSGNLGLAQGLEAAIDAAEALGDGFHLELVGDGPMLAELRERAARSAAANVSFRGLVEPAGAALLMRASDALLVPLADRPELAKYVPSKLFDCCAVGRPVIVAAAGESLRLATEAGAAIGAGPGDPRSLADAVRRLRDDPGLAAGLAERGRAFAAGYRREDQVGVLERVLRSVSG